PATEARDGEKQRRGRGGGNHDADGGRKGNAEHAEHDRGDQRRVTDPRGAHEVPAAHHAGASAPAVRFKRSATRATRSPSAFASSISSFDSVRFHSEATCVA